MTYRPNYKQEDAVLKTLDRHLLKRLWKYLSPYKGWIALCVLLLLISKLIEAAVPMAIGSLSQQIFTDYASVEKNRVFSYFMIAGVILFSFLLLGYLFDAFNAFLRTWIGQKAIFSLRTQVFDHIQHLPMRYFDGASIGKLMTRTIHDIDQINQMFSESIIPILGNIILFISMTMGIFFLDWRLGVVLVCLLPPLAWLTNRFRVVQRQCYDLIRSIVSAMNAFVQEHLLGVFTIRNFGLLKDEKKQFEKMNEDYCNGYLESIYNFAFFIAGIDFIQSLAMIAVFVVLMYSADGIQIGHFITFNLYTLMLFRPLADLAERYNVLQSAIAASERVFTVLHEPEEKNCKSIEEIGPVDSIAFKDVWFAYDKEEWILKGLSFEIKKGTSLAVVGVTGSGKTTILNILLRFYEFQKGSVLINGKDIREYPLHQLRKLFGVILQDPVIFSGTLYDNMCLYDPGITEEKVRKALDYLELPQSFLQRDKNLSTGETQLVSLARAIAHDRSVLILDEATANIDNETEKVIQNALQKIMHDKTTLVIAHRLSTIKNATSIIVLRDGVVVEHGSHQQLLDEKGVYEKLYRLQFQ